MELANCLIDLLLVKDDLQDKAVVLEHCTFGGFPFSLLHLSFFVAIIFTVAHIVFYADNWSEFLFGVKWRQLLQYKSRNSCNIGNTSNYQIGQSNLPPSVPIRNILDRLGCNKVIAEKKDNPKLSQKPLYNNIMKESKRYEIFEKLKHIQDILKQWKRSQGDSERNSGSARIVDIKQKSISQASIEKAACKCAKRRPLKRKGRTKKDFEQCRFYITSSVSSSSYKSVSRSYDHTVISTISPVLPNENTRFQSNISEKSVVKHEPQRKTSDHHLYVPLNTETSSLNTKISKLPTEYKSSHTSIVSNNALLLSKPHRRSATQWLKNFMRADRCPDALKVKDNCLNSYQSNIPADLLVGSQSPRISTVSKKKEASSLSEEIKTESSSDSLDDNPGKGVFPNCHVKQTSDESEISFSKHVCYTCDLLKDAAATHLTMLSPQRDTEVVTSTEKKASLKQEHTRRQLRRKVVKGKSPKKSQLTVKNSKRSPELKVTPTDQNKLVSKDVKKTKKRKCDPTGTTITPNRSLKSKLRVSIKQ